MYTQAVYQSRIVEEIAEAYKIENMRFVFADTNMYHPPRVYRMTDDDLGVGRNGKQYRTLYDSGHSTTFGHLTNNWRVKGYERLAAELDWHQKMDKWEYSYDLYQNEGEVDIDAFRFKF